MVNRIDKLKKIIINKGRRLAERRVIENYREYLNGSAVGHALVSYLVTPLLWPRRLRDRVMFSNHGIAQEIPRALNEMGYSVDIVDMTNTAWLPRRQYDLFIGHGGINFVRISDRLPAKTRRIYFSTGLYWRECNKRISQRCFDLACRRGFALPAYRAIDKSEEFANRVADGIICLGNASAVKTYDGFPRVLGINNAVFPFSWDKWKAKDFEAGRKNFLFFSGRGHLLKGLDIVLDAFLNTDMNLHVCQHQESDFMSVYWDDLKESSNIKFCGAIRMRSPQFESLALKCDWIISATCAEGQPGALLECMAYGLLPIIPEAANIDIDPRWGHLLPDCKIETVRETVQNASNTPSSEIKEKSILLMEATRDLYSVDRFRANLKNAINVILEGRQTQEP